MTTRFLCAVLGVLVLLVGSSLGVTGCGGGHGGPANVLEWKGAIAQGDPTLPDGSHFDEYSFDGRAGDYVVVTMDSDEVDPYVIVAVNHFPCWEWEVVGFDDDSGPGLDAYLPLVLPGMRKYYVAANTAFENDFGAYRLRVYFPYRGVGLAVPAPQVNGGASAQKPTGAKYLQPHASGPIRP